MFKKFWVTGVQREAEITARHWSEDKIIRSKSQINIKQRDELLLL